MIVVECCGKNGPDAAKALNCWRPRRDLNPCYRRERALACCKQRNLQRSGRSCMYRKSLLRTLGHRYSLYRPCTARNHEARSRALVLTSTMSEGV